MKEFITNIYRSVFNDTYLHASETEKAIFKLKQQNAHKSQAQNVIQRLK